VLYAMPEQRGPIRRLRHSFSRSSLLDDGRPGPRRGRSGQLTASGKDGARQ
jgi:hypothetical protein